MIPVDLYLLALGVNVHIINTLLCLICVLYTMIGGIKAVVWTDVVQMMVMVLAILIVICIGTFRIGSVSEIVSRASGMGILDLNYNLDLTSRTTVWNCSVAGILITTCYVGFNQSCVQRIMSLPSVKEARKSLWIFTFGFMLINFIVIFLGVTISAYFYDCDPLKAGFVKQSDGIVSYFLQKVTTNLSGVQGIYMSCIVCASLSTISAIINSLSGALYRDYFQYLISLEQHTDNFIIKIIVLLSGCVLVFCGFIVEKSKSTAVQLVFTSMNLTYASYISTFLLGFLAPRIHSKPIFIANIIGFTVMLFVILKCQMQSGDFQYRPVEKSTSGCVSLNVTTSENHKPYPEKFDVFKMSHHLYVVFGSSIIWIIAEVLSKVLRSKDVVERMDLKLFAPWIRNSLQKVRMDIELVEQRAPLK